MMVNVYGQRCVRNSKGEIKSGWGKGSSVSPRPLGVSVVEGDFAGILVVQASVLPFCPNSTGGGVHRRWVQKASSCSGTLD